MSSAIEQEILKTTHAKSQTDETRQLYLQRLAVMVSEISEGAFDMMSIPAQNWSNKAIDAINNSVDLPEFADTIEETLTKTEEVAKKSGFIKKVAGFAKKTKGTVVIDRYGFKEGCKTSEAIKMFERGVKMAEVTRKFGTAKYNVIRELERAGHLVEHKGALIKVTHKDDAKAKDNSTEV